VLLVTMAGRQAGVCGDERWRDKGQGKEDN
jgi:hypothetical protein